MATRQELETEIARVMKTANALARLMNCHFVLVPWKVEAFLARADVD